MQGVESPVDGNLVTSACFLDHDLGNVQLKPISLCVPPINGNFLPSSSQKIARRPGGQV